MIRFTSPTFINITKVTGLCLGLLTIAQVGAQASSQGVMLQQPQLLALASGANGEATIDSSHYYTPSENSPRLPEGSGTSGRRGGSCLARGTTEFTALGPRSTTGLTTTERPKFSWYVSPAENGLPLLFRLLETQSNGRPKPIYWYELTAQTGFMSHELSSNFPPLEIGKSYMWQVVVKCEEGQSLISSLPIQRVSSTSELTEQLSTATTNAERAIIYGNEGLWYDAFAQVVAINAPSEGDIRAGLLRDLASVEADEQGISAILLAIAEETDTPQFNDSGSQP
ncbi:MAG: DUF928 domain-containing protein [Cyanobacteria bacterium J06642_11]